MIHPLERFGYYQVRDQRYFNKVQALEASTTLGAVPTWNFNDEAFSHYDWSAEPSFSLDEAYRLRAQQLRDKYDHLILLYSGGIDSHTILTTCLRHDIKIDAVLIYGTYEFDPNRDDIHNLEQYNVAIPFAQRYQDRYDLKILDISSYFDRYYHADWFYQSGSCLYPTQFSMAYIYRDPYVQDWLNKGNTAIIRGIEKPRVIYRDGGYYYGFFDSYIPAVDPEIAQNTEFFYWSPDCPWLVAKQAHVIKNYFKNFHPELAHLLTDSGYQQDTIDRYITPLIYDAGVPPGEKPTYYSVGKGTKSPMFNLKEGFFHSSKIELDSQRLWHAGIRKLENIISREFKNQGLLIKGLKEFWSPLYYLG